MTPGGALPLVMLPGIEGARGVFDELIGALPDRRCRVLGLPSRPDGQPLTIDGLATAVLERIECDAFHIFGASIGGLVGWQVATLAPHRVRSLVTLGTMPSTAHRPAVIALAAAVLDRTPAPIRRQLWRRHLRAVLLREGVDAARVGALLGELPASHRWPAQLAAVAAWSPSGPPPVPTLWLRGVAEREASWTLADARRALPCVTVGAVPGGHRAMLTHPASVASALAHHLQVVGG